MFLNFNTVPANFNAGERQAGVGLVETMIGLFVLAVGLLGAISLQTSAVQRDQQAYYYSQSYFLVQDLAERMRANPTGAKDYPIFFNAPAKTSKNCMNVACDAAQLADWDVNRWNRLVRVTLPAGRPEIVYDVADDEYIISIQYDEDRRNRIGIRSVSFEAVSVVVKF